MTRARTASLLVLALGVLSCGGPGNDARATTRSPTPDCRSGIGRNVPTRVGTQRVLVHLPACYDRDVGARYPVIVLIHGSDADEHQWIDIGATSDADRLTREGSIAPCVLVMPDEGDDSSTEEARNAVGLVPWIDATFRTVPDAAHRAIGGISRGGSAALQAAAGRPDLFGVAAGHSPSVPPDVPAVARGLQALSGRIWMDVGTGDGLHDRVASLVESLRHDGIAVRYHVHDGGHDRSYWRRNMADYLTFDAARWR